MQFGMSGVVITRAAGPAMWRRAAQSEAEVAAAAGGATPRLRAKVWPGVGHCGEDGLARGKKRPGDDLKAADGGSQAGCDSTVAASRSGGWIDPPATWMDKADA